MALCAGGGEWGPALLRRAPWLALAVLVLAGAIAMRLVQDTLIHTRPSNYGNASTSANSIATTRVLSPYTSQLVHVLFGGL